jgi:limonene-1,2-epoxide hydrolase
MSKTDEGLIELVRGAMEAFNRGDFESAVKTAHPEVVLRRLGGLPEVRGVDAFRKWMEPDAFESQQTVLQAFEVEGNRVLVRQHTVARGAGSGIETGIDSLAVWTFDDENRVARVELFLPHEEEEARRALRGR